MTPLPGVLLAHQNKKDFSIPFTLTLNNKCLYADSPLPTNQSQLPLIASAIFIPHKRKLFLVRRPPTPKVFYHARNEGMIHGTTVHRDRKC